jgi:hypothetical protein
MTPWEIKGREFGNCSCDYSCPCQFDALPTNGHCRGLGAFAIDEGYHGETRLDGLKAAGVYRWPGPIHEGNGEFFLVVDRNAAPEQREALLRILRGQDTDPFATVFQVFASTCDTEHEPIVADIDFQLDIDGRRANVFIEGVLDMRGEPILNPVSGEEHRVRIVQPQGFEFSEAEIGRGWSKSLGPVAYEVGDTYGQFAHIHLNNHGIVRP